MQPVEIPTSSLWFLGCCSVGVGYIKPQHRQVTMVTLLYSIIFEIILVCSRHPGGPGTPLKSNIKLVDRFFFLGFFHIWAKKKKGLHASSSSSSSRPPSHVTGCSCSISRTLC